MELIKPMTNNIAIRVENLSKRYRMGQYVGSGAQYKTLRESLTNAVSSSFRALKPNTQDPKPNYIWALRDISFEVKRGEVLGIIGRNGAGKSTLLKVLTRITEPTEGRAELKGRVGSLLEVGTGFHPELTGRENVYLSGAILGMTRKEIDRKFDEIVEFSGVERFIDTPVKRYSSGMRVRLGFAVAAHLEPEILLIDEVLAVGDAAFQKKCLGKMGDVAREGRTVLFVSHNMGAIARLCRRCILLDEGHIVAEGAPRQVIDTYLSSGMLPNEAEVEYALDPAKAVQIRRVRLLDDSGCPSVELDRTHPFRVCMEVEAHQDVSGVMFELALDRADGTRISDSFSADEMREYLSLQAGLSYLVEVEFPGSLLNTGGYRIRVSANRRGVSVFDVRWPCTFRLHNWGDFSSFAGKNYAGCLQLSLPWKVARLPR